MINDLILNLANQNILITVADGELIINAPKDVLTETLIDTIRKNKAALITYLSGNGATGKGAFDSIPSIAEQASYPLSYAQRRLWIASQWEGGSTAYNIAMAYVFDGNLSIPALEYAFNTLISRHESLRTAFKENEAGEIRQYILPVDEINFKIEKYELDAELIEAAVKEEYKRPFDLTAAPLLRATLFHESPNTWVFTYVMHHIISDGSSMNILLNELLLFYHAYINGSSHSLKPLRIHYKDYTAWQLGQDETESDQKYWLQQFEGEIPVIALMGDYARPAVKTFNGNIIHRKLKTGLAQKLLQLSQQEGATLFMGLLATVNTLLYRYTQQEDIVLGSPVAGRNHADLEDQIGFYVNTLPLRSRFKGSDSFLELLKAVKQTTLQAYDHQAYPVDQLVEDLRIPRSPSRHPLFDIVVVLQNSESGTQQGIDGLTVKRYEQGEDLTSKFDIVFNFSSVGDELKLDLEYNTDIYTGSTIAQLFTHFESLLTAITVKPGTALQQLEYLSAAERHLLTEGLNATTTGYPRYSSITSLFEAQVKETPYNTALVFEEHRFTYAELNKWSNRLSDYLRRKYAVGKGDLVGIKLERSEWIIIAVLGILKAGAAYVPIDTEYPAERVADMLSDCASNVVIDEAFLTAFRECAAALEELDVSAGTAAGDLAYVMFTSGSTGRPKGVMVEHRAVVRLVKNTEFIALNGNEVVLSTGALSFDATTFEYWSTLLNGGCLVLCPQNVLLEPTALSQLMQTEKIDTIWFTAGWLNQLVDGHIALFAGLRTLLAGGDRLSPVHIAKLRSHYPELIIINGYGPTENTTFSLTYNIKEVAANIPVGRPISNSYAYILDPHQQLLPVGVAGEICVGGDGLSRGYLNRPELTKEKFVVNPFRAGERMYLTGDLGRWLPDGNIEFLGRKDAQVKVRGHRIELGEIEAALLAHPEITDVVVIVREKPAEEKEIVAYLVGTTTFTAAGLRTFLGNSLPVYMLPAHYVQLEELPLTPNGKVDRKCLPAPEGQDLNSGVVYIAPRNDKEQALVAVFEEVLHKHPIGIHDNFFVMGGDSIKSIQIAARLKQRGYRVAIQDILRYPEVAHLSVHVQVAARVPDQGIISGPVPLGPVQASFLEHGTEDHKHHFNQSVLLESNTPIDETALRASLSALTRHHDALRMVFRHTPDGWIQENLGTEQGYHLEVHATEDRLPYYEKMQEGIDLANGPLLRAGLFHNKLLLIIHHLVVDGVSWRILLEDLSTLYDQYTKGLPFSLPQKTDSFQYWQQQLRSYNVADEAPYWSELTSLVLPAFPIEMPDGTNLMRDTVSGSFILDEKITADLQHHCYKAYRTEINDILLTGLAIAIEEVFGIKRVAVQMEGHGREDIGMDVDVSRTVGWFTSLYPVVLDMGYADPVAQLVSVKEQLHRVPNKGIGYGLLRHARHLQPAVSFNYLGDFGDNIASSDTAAHFSYSAEAHGHDFSPLLARDVLLDVSGLMAGGRLQLSVTYSNQQYHAATIAQLLDSYRLHLEALISHLSQETSVHLTPVDLTCKDLTISALAELTSRYTIEDVYPLSPLQQGLYYHWLTNPDAAAYFVQMSFRACGRVDIALLEQSYQMLVDRHAVLRTFFTENLLQVVQKNVKGNFHYDTIHGDIEAAVQDYRSSDRARGFDLHAGSQMRLGILSLGDDNYEFIWSFHHILMDGWCGSILIKEFFEVYNGLLDGIMPEMKPVQPYSEYFNWLAKKDKPATLDYWKKYLSDYESVSSIPTKSTDVAGDFTAEKERFLLAGDIRSRLRDLCADLGITESTFIQAMWGVLLARYNNTDDVVFGAVVAGRPGEVAGIEDMIGLFINTVPVRIKVDDTCTVSSLLQSVQQESIESSAHHYVQLAEVQSESELGRNLFDHILVYENYPVQEITGNEEANTSSHLTLLSSTILEQTNYNLSITVNPGDALEVSFTYNHNIFDQEQISRLAKHFYTLIGHAVNRPSQTLGELSYLTEEEYQQLTRGFNNTTVAYPENDTIAHLFSQQVKQSPAAIAVEYGTAKLSYQELDTLSNQFAHYLRDNYSIAHEDLVGILLDRSEWMVITILGIIKSGAAYVPIDPSYPEERISYMLADSNARLLINEEELARFRTVAASYNSGLPASLPSPAHLAYVIYTSGSTGKPKGVMIEHRSLSARMQYFRDTYGTGPADNIIFYRSYSFDGAIEEYLLPIVTGAKCCIAPPDFKDNIVENLYDFIEKYSITKINMPPVLLQELMLAADEEASFRLRSLKHVVSGGDKLTVKTVNDFVTRFKTTLHNAYGPTENTDDSTNWPAHFLEASIVPIGKPVSCSSVYILDNHLRLLPVGVTGEICVGGDGLSRGYLNRPELTQEKFVANPYEPGQRIYLTGDVGRWLPDGNIEFLGRKDEQVKVRGYRIELGEIESLLLGHPGINSAVVVAREHVSGEKELVAYIVGDEGLTTADVRLYLGELLPSYMLPAHYVQLEELPLNPNGKIDRKRLPAPEGQDMGTGVSYLAPRNEMERQLVAVFEEVLHKHPIGIRDNFFVLGGDSIKSIQIASRLKQRGYRVTIQDILRYPELANLGKHIQVLSRIADQGLVTGIVPLGPIQASFLEHGPHDHKHHFNQSVLLKGNPRIDESRLRKALSALVLHHDALRMVYRQTAEGWLQENLGAEQGYHLEVHKTNDPLAYYEQLQSGFDLEHGPLLRAGLFHSDDADRLLLVIHHLVVDGVSWRILLEDLSTLYAQSTQGIAFSLPQKTDSFRYWQEQLHSFDVTHEAGYWSQITSTDLPLDHANGTNHVKDAVSVSFILDERTTATLQQHCYKAYRTEINDILLTALALSIEEVFNLTRVAIQMEGHGREDIGKDVDVSRTVGWFTTLYPVVLEMGYADQLAQLIGVKEQLHRIPNKGIGYGLLHPIPHVKARVSFNYLGEFGTATLNNQFFNHAAESHGHDFSPMLERDVLLGISGLIAAGRLQLTFTYSSQQYEASTIEKLSASYRHHLEALINKLSRETTEHITPVDLTYKSLQVAGLSELTADYTIEDIYPLSPLQEGLYYHWATHPQAPAYFEQVSYRIRGKLNIQLLEQAYQRLVSRHAVLRTFFTERLGDRLLQVVQKNVKGDFHYEIINGEIEEAVRAYRSADRSRGFRLDNGSQMRLCILDLGEDTYELIWSYHHILMDGWCSSILSKEFFDLYYGQTELKPVQAYANYFRWLEKQDKQLTLNYWRNYLQGYDTLSGLPKQSLSEVYQAQKYKLKIKSEGIKELCGKYGFTENTFIQGMWGVLLSKYNNTDDVVFGTTVSGRPAEVKGIEEMIGLFINTIPVRVPVHNKTIRTLLQELQQSNIESTPHHYVQLAEVQMESALGRNLFDHIIVFENYPVEEIVERSIQEHEKLSFLSYDSFEQTNYDLLLVVVPGEEIEIQFNYNVNKYAPALMERAANQLLVLIDQALHNPNQTVRELKILDEKEQHQLINEFNQTAVEYEQGTILSLFEQQVRNTPAATALIFQGKKLTYAELNASANQFAHYLHTSLGLHAGDLAGILLDRSEWMIISILGVLKSGAAYLPIDPAYPKSRIDYMLTDSGCKVLVDNEVLTQFKSDTHNYNSEVPPAKTNSEGLAYVIYTSGSTAAPKGCAITHGSLYNYIQWATSCYFTDLPCFGLFTSLSFDLTVTSIFCPLAKGGRLFLYDQDDEISGVLQHSFSIESGINSIKLTPSHISILEQLDLSSTTMTAAIVGGEEVTPKHVSILKKINPQIRIYNEYGPTEATVGCIVKELEENTPVLIGKPIANMHIYILDRYGDLSPVGVPGELYIGGSQLARGYLNNPALTGKKFLTDPFRENERIYKTGDLAAWLPDGNIRFLGRNDDQVKIRGYRISLGEIESALLDYPGVTTAAVIASGVENAERKLIAYFVAGTNETSAAIRKYMQDKFPAYMIPSHFVQMGSIPLTVNGKIDRRRLPAPGESSNETYVAPRNEIEEKLVVVWQQLLHRDKIGVEDNFFEAGGNSIMIIKLAKQTSAILNIEVNITLLFRYPTIKDLVDYVLQEQVLVEEEEIDRDQLLDDLNKFE
ncbi:non-ribosomal peptide synthetase [Chitinophaga silvisoli]|uniref:Amino acid adenylation domain-containing protein n=1 Tax=Chitinophaga silvisoli TaxID=2291814 RepID=A0A3E1P006_9BACT|nr:non-ribosomal peptide synthetase [Chitinophaga silvisoli]RFM33509.1 amino acid adenylation domain-containing protein [Chitinophaga silvisoli]